MQRLRQLTFASLQCDRKKRRTRREIFPERMDGLIPWERLEARIAPVYPKGGGKGRQPHPLSVMLRVHCVQLFYNLSDPLMEDQLYEAESIRRFAGVSLEKVPDETTILNFRHRLENHGLAQQLFEDIRDHLAEQGVFLKKGTIVDATIISAPSSTKNESNARDPEMHQTKKGNQWHFGMKLHIGTDTRGLVHHLEGTAANVHDLTPSDQLLHGEEEQVWGDSGYRGIGKRAEHAPGSAAAKAEKAKARVRARVEHPFRIVKRVFGYDMVRYRGLDKNVQRLALLLGFSNLMIAQPHLQ